MRGKTDEDAFEEMLAEGLPQEKARELAPHKAIPGNKPSNTLLLDRVDPQGLGALVALYEHKVFVQGALWDIGIPSTSGAWSWASSSARPLRNALRPTAGRTSREKIVQPPA